MDHGRVAVVEDVRPGDELTFFYPATEWDMAVPFDCTCGAPECLGRIAGAKHLPRDLLSRYRLARHVREAISVYEPTVR